MSAQDPQTNPNFDEFPVPDLASWRAEVERLLKGAPFEKRMISRTLEGPTLRPLYTAADVQGKSAAFADRTSGGTWRLIEDPADLNATPDPIGVAARSGGTVAPADWDGLAGADGILVDTAPYAEAGADAPLQLACALSGGVETLRRFEARGDDIETILPRLILGFRLGGHLFIEAAKLRAARLAWRRVLEAVSVPENARRAVLHAATAERTKSLYDPHTNILRATTEAFAAVIGGADSLYVAPFDAPAGEASDLGRRVARNIQLILREEAHLGKVLDPGGGSWYLETLTRDLAATAWERFQSIEQVGGLLAALEKGLIRDLIAVTARTRAEAAATGRGTIVGVNRYPAPESGAPVTLPEDDALDDPSIRPRRAAEPFERLRAAVERHRADKSELTVHLATLGPAARYMPRLDFIASFFAAGGFAVGRARDAASPADTATAAIAAAPAAVCLVGVDDTWESGAPEAAALIRAAMPDAPLYLAGLPRDEAIAAGLREAGVDAFIHLRSNMLEILGDLAARLEVDA